MGRLVDCTEDVIDAIGIYLEAHHIARLHLTGDLQLAAKLRTLRCTTSTLNVADERSTLYKRLINSFEVVTAPFAMINFASLPSLSKLRRLHLRKNRSDDLALADVYGHPVDFSSLPSLDTLDIGDPYVVTRPIKLPKSITSLSLYSIDCDEPVHDLASLPNLHTIWFGLTSREVGVHVSFFHTVEWPASLTSLSIPIFQPDEAIFSCLPASLEHLRILQDSVDALDLAIIGETLPRLASLEIGDREVVITGPLPSTLTRLELYQLNIPEGSTLTEAFSHLPLSLTNLDISNIAYNDASVQDAIDDRERGFMLVMPRLALPSLEHATCLGFSSRKDLDPSRAFKAALFEAMGKHGLDAVSIMAFLDDGIWTFQRNFSIRRIAQMLEGDVDEAMLRRAMAGRLPMNLSFHGSWETPTGNSYTESCIKLLERGFTHTFDAFKYFCAPSFSTRGALPERARLAIRTLCVSPGWTEEWEKFLSSNDLPAVTSVYIRNIVNQDVNPALDLICRNAQHLPRLEVIHFQDHLNPINIGDTTLRLLRDIRLYVDKKNACLSYFVTKDVASADGKL
jgi:hypothetical protein